MAKYPFRPQCLFVCARVASLWANFDKRSGPFHHYKQQYSYDSPPHPRSAISSKSQLVLDLVPLPTIQYEPWPVHAKEVCEPHLNPPVRMNCPGVSFQTRARGKKFIRTGGSDVVRELSRKTLQQQMTGFSLPLFQIGVQGELLNCAPSKKETRV